MEYTLHPTFRDPKRVITSGANRFALLSSGWGTFTIQIVIAHKDGNITSASYPLKLEEEAWPRPQSPGFEGGAPQARMLEVMEEADKYRWRRLGTLARKAGIPEERALEILRQPAAEDVCREAGFEALDGQPMWGA